MDIQVIGLEQACAALKALPELVVKQCVAKALVSASVPVFEELAARTPVKTGLLQESIATNVVIDNQGRGGRSQIGFSGDQARIARFVEYGHRQVGHPRHKNEGTVQAHPFMRPALQASAQASVEAFTTTLTELVKEL